VDNSVDKLCLTNDVKTRVGSSPGRGGHPVVARSVTVLILCSTPTHSSSFPPTPVKVGFSPNSLLNGLE